ncbi:MAG: hypothetical protein WDN03_03495 [Rhizomicrobium sp.]
MRRPWDAIAWWEIRRIAFNAALLVAGAVTVLVVLGLGDSMVPPGEDVVEPSLLFLLGAAYAVAANIFYTLGWLTELLWSAGDTSRTAAQRPRVFRLGMIVSILLTLAPSVPMLLLWLVHRRA